MKFICFNGELYAADKAVLTSQNRSFKYGDGLFETIKVFKDKILLEEIHFERLFLSLQVLQITIHSSFDKKTLSKKIIQLCEKNQCSSCARVRLAVYRNNENFAEYIIETIPLMQEYNQWNEPGYSIDIYPYARKAADAFANLKTANYLPYVMADKYAKEKKLDEVLVLNHANRICDASKANIFLVYKNEIITPALTEGCISGVMRKYLIDALKKNDFVVKQTSINEEQLYHADEIFLSNAIVGIRWVKSFRNKIFGKKKSKSIYKNLVESLYL